MSSDALRLVIEQMPADDRLALAQVDENLCQFALKWHDVKTIIYDHYRVFMTAGNTFEHSVKLEGENHMDGLKWACEVAPAARNIIIQDIITDEHLLALKDRMAKAARLSIDSSNFGRSSSIRWKEIIHFEQLRSLYILMRENVQLNLFHRISKETAELLFVPSLRKVCLTGIVLTQPVLEAISSLKNLRFLDLIGCAVDTESSQSFITALKGNKELRQLSLPPSMFSFTKATHYDSTPDFKHLALQKLSLYMEEYDDIHFWNQLKTIFSPQLEMLVLYGNIYRLKLCRHLKNWKGFKIDFGPMTSIKAAPEGAKDEYHLVNHHVWRSPYRPGTPPTVQESWRLDLAALEKAIEEEAQPRRRAPAADRGIAVRGNRGRRGRGGVVARGTVRRRRVVSAPALTASVSAAPAARVASVPLDVGSPLHTSTPIVADVARPAPPPPPAPVEVVVLERNPTAPNPSAAPTPEQRAAEVDAITDIVLNNVRQEISRIDSEGANRPQNGEQNGGQAPQ